MSRDLERMTDWLPARNAVILSMLAEHGIAATIERHGAAAVRRAQLAEREGTDDAHREAAA